MLVSRILLRLRFACVCALALAAIFNASITAGDHASLGSVFYLLLSFAIAACTIGGEFVLRREWRRHAGDDPPMQGGRAG